MRRLDVAPDAERDIDDLLAFSEARFGPAVADRYRLLIGAALADLCAEPTLPTAASHPEAPPDLRLYPLRYSRTRVPAPDRIATPRHIVSPAKLASDVMSTEL